MTSKSPTPMTLTNAQDSSLPFASVDIPSSPTGTGPWGMQKSPDELRSFLSCLLQEAIDIIDETGLFDDEDDDDDEVQNGADVGRSTAAMDLPSTSEANDQEDTLPKEMSGANSEVTPPRQ